MEFEMVYFFKLFFVFSTANNTGSQNISTLQCIQKIIFEPSKSLIWSTSLREILPCSLKFFECFLSLDRDRLSYSKQHAFCQYLVHQVPFCFCVISRSPWKSWLVHSQCHWIKSCIFTTSKVFSKLSLIAHKSDSLVLVLVPFADPIGSTGKFAKKKYFLLGSYRDQD